MNVKRLLTERWILQHMDWFSGKVLHKLSLELAYKLDVKIWPFYKARQQESNEKINWERQNYLPSNTQVEGKLSSKYYLRFSG